jgi:hypothetical protein
MGLDKVKAKGFGSIALTALGLAACQLPTNVALKHIDELRAQQDSCLKSNISQFEDPGSDPKQVGRFVAMSCTTQTEKLVQYAVPYATPKERKAFDDDAAMRAAGYVMLSRGAVPNG